MPKQSVEYYCWMHMIARCYNPNNPGYKHYGARGITVCDRWRKSRNFLDDMGPKPSPKHCLDRIDNEKGYSPENCRWTTRLVNNNNKRTTVLITWRDRTMSVAEWSRVLGIQETTLWRRVRVLHWPIERAFTEPLGLGRSESQKGHAKYPLPETRAAARQRVRKSLKT